MSLLGFGLLNAGASVLGNALGSSSQASANRANLRIAQMNNDFGREMFDKQVKYNWDMWNATNDYNSAANQRARLEQAGLNPYLMLNGGSAGVAEGGSSVGLPSGTPAHMDSFRPDFNGISEAFMQERSIESQTNLANAQAAKTLAEAENINVGNGYQQRMLELDLLNRMDTHKINDRNIKFGLATFDNDVAINKIQRDIASSTDAELKSRTALNDIQAVLSKEQVKWIAPQALQSIAESRARAFASYESGKLSRQEAVESLARSLVAEEQRNGISLDNKGKSLTLDRARKTAERLLKVEFDELDARSSEARARDKNAKGVTPPKWQRALNHIRDVLSLPTVPLSGALKAIK